MILPDLALASRSNKEYTESGIDCFAECRDKLHFIRYPHQISYQYNSRGFRDSEWSDSIGELSNSIWCVGDSFTVGIGSALEHTWTNVLQEATGERCINVSMDGASNTWIARKANQIIEELHPTTLVIQWSYAHRDELPDATLSDESRRLHYLGRDNFEVLPQLQRTAKCIASIVPYQTNVIHSFIPNWCEMHGDEVRKSWGYFGGEKWPSCPTTPEEFAKIHPSVLQQFVEFNLLDMIVDYFASMKLMNEIMGRIVHVPEIKTLDLARDGFHYGPKTATKFVDDLITLI